MKLHIKKGYSKKIVGVSPQLDGTYALDQGITYTIRMKSTPSGDFSVEQDNWVYAPNGGKWTIVPFNHYFPMEQMFIPDHTLIEAVYTTSDRAVEINTDASVEAQTKAVMLNLGINDDTGMFVKSVGSVVAGVFGGSAFVAALLSPDPASKMIVAFALDGWATFCLVSDISDSFNYFEAKDFRKACNNGKLNVIFTRWGYASAINNLWNPWTTSCYINKYNYDSMNGYVKGTITLNNSVQDVIDYCRL